jgi:tRNA(Ile)-lysidine synthase
MRKRLASHIADNFPEFTEQPFLLACSGGVDSVVLAHLLKGLDFRFELAHCNFQLRGEESDRDAEFVSDLAKELRLKLNIKCFKTKRYANKHKLSIQESARQLRYSWFRELLQERSLSFTVTAHHADDVLETFLINLTRGTGLDGLSGIPARAPGIRRPLLAFSGKEIRSYAKKKGVRWREDSSNLENKYLRNRLRQKVIPALKESDPRFQSNFEKSLKFLRGSQALVRNHIAVIRASLFTSKGGITKIPVASLVNLKPQDAYLFELFHPYGFSDWKALDRLLEGGSGKELISPTHILLRDREHLLLKEQSPPDPTIYEIDLSVSRPKAPITLEITNVKDLGPGHRNVLFVDGETLKGGVQLRKWRKGDYFYPLGMEGKQKISKYFKDHKFSRFDKEAQWLLCSGEDVVWIAGHRGDERFKVRKDTTQILKIEWIDSEEPS